MTPVMTSAWFSTMSATSGVSMTPGHGVDAYAPGRVLDRGTAGRPDMLAVLRAAAGRDPLDQRVTGLIGELSARSTDFSTRWAKHNVRRHARGRKVVNHPVVGTMDLTYDDFALPGDPHVSITTYTADPGTPSADTLTLPATWADARKQPRTPNAEAHGSSHVS